MFNVQSLVWPTLSAVQSLGGLCGWCCQATVRVAHDVHSTVVAQRGRRLRRQPAAAGLTHLLGTEQPELQMRPAVSRIKGTDERTRGSRERSPTRKRF